MAYSTAVSHPCLMNFINYEISTFEDMALMKLAIHLCHAYQDLKLEILCLQGSFAYQNCKDRYQDAWHFVNSPDWQVYVKKKAMAILESISLPNKFKQKVIARIWIIGLQWFSWVKQQTGKFALKGEFCVNFLIPEDWTEQGRLKEKDIAERLVQDQDIDIFRRYCIACTYILQTHILDLWNQIPESMKIFFPTTKISNQITNPCLALLWSFATRDEVFLNTKYIYEQTIFEEVSNEGASNVLVEDLEISREKVGEYMDEKDSEEASNVGFTNKGISWEIEAKYKYRDEKGMDEGVNGNDTEEDTDEEDTYEYTDEEDEEVPNEEGIWCYLLEKSIKIGNEAAVRYCWSRMQEKNVIKFAFSALSLWQSAEISIFQVKCFIFHKLPTAEKIRYSNIFFFLFSQMSQDTQLTFFKSAFENETFLCILDCLLDWPYQQYFLSIITQLWEVLPKRFFGCMLLSILNKHKSQNTVLHLDFDYVELFSVLLKQSPESFQRYLFNDEMHASHSSIRLFPQLAKKPFDYKFVGIFKLLIMQATSQEEKEILYSTLGFSLCAHLISKRDFKLLDNVLAECLPEDQVVYLKKQFITDGHSILVELIQKEDLKMLDIVLMACLPKDSVILFKKQLILSDWGPFICMHLISTRRLKELEILLTESLTEDEIITLKRNLIFGEEITTIYFKAVKVGDEAYVNTLLDWGLLSVDEIYNLKREIPFRMKFLYDCSRLVFENKLDTLHRIVCWFLPDAEMQQQFKMAFAKNKFVYSNSY